MGPVAEIGAVRAFFLRALIWRARCAGRAGSLRHAAALERPERVSLRGFGCRLRWAQRRCSLVQRRFQLAERRCAVHQRPLRFSQQGVHRNRAGLIATDTAEMRNRTAPIEIGTKQLGVMLI